MRGLFLLEVMVFTACLITAGLKLAPALKGDRRAQKHLGWSVVAAIVLIILMSETT